MYQTKYIVDILIVENTAKFRLHFLISPQIMKVNVDFSIVKVHSHFRFNFKYIMVLLLHIARLQPNFYHNFNIFLGNCFITFS